MTLPNFVVTGNLKEIFGDVASDELVESAMSRAVITFTSNVPADNYVTWGDTLYRVPEVPAQVDTDGNIVNAFDGGEVRLLAQDDGLNVRGLQWRVKITLPPTAIPSRPSAMMRTFWFNALADGASQDLKTVVPVVGNPVHGIIINNNGFTLVDDGTGLFSIVPGGVFQYKGEKANQAAMLATSGIAGDWITRSDTATSWIITGSDPTQLSSWTQLPFPSVTWANLSGRPAVVAAGADQAAARTSIALGNVDNTADTAKPVSTAQQTALDAKVFNLVPTTDKTSAYTAAVNDLVVCDATAGSFTVTLPPTPADKARIAVKKNDTGPYAVTVQRSGSDVFNKTAGPTSLPITLQDGTVTFQYKASTGIWYVVGHGNSVAGLDSRYFVRTLDQNFGGSQLLDSNGAAALSLDATASAVNYLRLLNSAAGSALILKAEGADTNIPVTFRTKGTGAFAIVDGPNRNVAGFQPIASSVNYWWFAPSTTGNAINVQALGTDTNISINLIPKGSGVLQSGGTAVLLTGGALGTPASGTLTNCTGLPVTGIAASTATALGVGTVELGHASDTTLSRSAAGILAVEGVAVPTISSTDTQSNKTLAAPNLTGTTKVATAGVVELYNTSDQTTNFEKTVLRNNSNVTELLNMAGGTASVRTLRIGMPSGVGGTTLSRYLEFAPTAPFVNFSGSTGTAANLFALMSGASLTGAAGTQAVLAIVPTVTQTVTAGYTCLLINPTESTTGSGTKRLIDAQVGGTSKFSVDNTGKMSPGGTAVIWTSGTGTPEAVLTAPVGSLFTRTDGGALTTLYVKESGVGNTGWVAK